MQKGKAICETNKKNLKDFTDIITVSIYYCSYSNSANNHEGHDKRSCKLQQGL